jgi:hypothetical protein
MHASRIGFFAILTLALTLSVLSYSLGRARVVPSAQSSPQTPAVQTPAQAPAESSPAGPRRASSQRQTPCWRLAGIAPELVNKRWHIEDNAKGRISAVCTDPALTAEKKHEKIQEINDQTEQEIAKIIPPKQFEAFKSCQAQRDQEKAKRKGTKMEKELGPCGGIIPPETPSHRHQPGNPPNQ